MNDKKTQIDLLIEEAQKRLIDLRAIFSVHELDTHELDNLYFRLAAREAALLLNATVDIIDET